MIRLYSPKTKAPCFLYREAEKLGWLVNEPATADFLLLPFKYEIIYDFSDAEISNEGLSPGDIRLFKKIARELDELSFALNRKLIVFFYRDPDIQLTFRNAFIFRTSTRSSWQRKYEFGMPAFIEDFGPTPLFKPNTWKAIPRVSFRGSSAPLRLPFGTMLRIMVNQGAKKMGTSFRVKTWYNEGYLLRREAILSVQKQTKGLISDIVLNPQNQFSDKLVKEYQQSLQDNDYFICTRGHGNYSFRLYEVMRNGRVPVFIQTDSLLPAPELIEWKNLTVWVEASEVKYTAEKLLDFHYSLKTDEFIELQKQIYQCWVKYLTYDGFAAYLLHQFLPGIKVQVATC